jgi:hypothetical protein
MMVTKSRKEYKQQWRKEHKVNIKTSNKKWYDKNTDYQKLQFLEYLGVCKCSRCGELGYKTVILHTRKTGKQTKYIQITHQKYSQLKGRWWTYKNCSCGVYEDSPLPNKVAIYGDDKK